MLGFGRHVVLVVLGQHLARHKKTITADLTLSDHALALFEEVWQQPGISDRNVVLGIGDDKAHDLAFTP